MLNNYELDEMPNHYGMNLNDIVMKDEIKKLTPKSGNYIINLESSAAGNSGSHWIALYIQEKECFYFDSFGIICPTEITKSCKRIPNSKLCYNDFQIQHVDAETCGWFCLIFFLKMNSCYLFCFFLKFILFTLILRFFLIGL